MKKRIMGLVLLVVLILMFGGVVFASDTPALKASFINQDPEPAGPGQYVELKVRVDNVGLGDAEDVKLVFDEAFPFSLDQGVLPEIYLGTIGANQKDDLGAIVKYRVRVADDAVEGDNEVDFTILAKGQSPQTFTFDIDIKTQDSGLTIQKVTSDELVQGKSGQVEVVLENPSDSLLRDVTVSLGLISNDLPFAPADSSTVKKLSTLASSGTAIFRFNLIPFPDASSGVYKIPLNISYYDSTSQLVSKTDLIGVVIGSDADISYYVESENFVLGQGSGVLTLNFVNKGLIDVKFLDVIVSNTADYELMSSSEAYIGNVDSDDFETADFKIKKLNEKSEFNFVGTATFMDANNNEQTIDFEIPVKLFPGTKSNGLPTWAILLLLVVVIIVGYKIFMVIKAKKRR